MVCQSEGWSLVQRKPVQKQEWVQELWRGLAESCSRRIMGNSVPVTLSHVIVASKILNHQWVSPLLQISCLSCLTCFMIGAFLGLLLQGRYCSYQCDYPGAYITYGFQIGSASTSVGSAGVRLGASGFEQGSGAWWISQHKCLLRLLVAASEPGPVMPLTVHLPSISEFAIAFKEFLRGKRVCDQEK